MKQQHWRTLVPALNRVFVCTCGVIDHGADQAPDHHTTSHSPGWIGFARTDIYALDWTFLLLCWAECHHLWQWHLRRPTTVFGG
jgi:hypothetical protein